MVVRLGWEKVNCSACPLPPAPRRAASPRRQPSQSTAHSRACLHCVYIELDHPVKTSQKATVFNNKRLMSLSPGTVRCVVCDLGWRIPSVERSRCESATATTKDQCHDVLWKYEGEQTATRERCMGIGGET